MEAKHPRISQDPKVMVGKPVIRGTRITVEQMLRMLGNGHSVEELAAAYKIDREDLLACQAYAADRLADLSSVAAE